MRYYRDVSVALDEEPDGTWDVQVIEGGLLETSKAPDRAAAIAEAKRLLGVALGEEPPAPTDWDVLRRRVHALKRRQGFLVAGGLRVGDVVRYEGRSMLVRGITTTPPSLDVVLDVFTDAGEHVEAYVRPGEHLPYLGHIDTETGR